MSRKYLRVLGVLSAMAASVLLLAACGGGSSSTGSGSSSTTESNSESSPGGGEGVDLAAAKKLLAPFTGHPSAFPVSEPLKEKPPADSKFIYLQCGTPLCEIQWGLIEGAAKTLGVSVSRIKAGNSAQDVANAFDAAVAENPAAVIVPALEPSLFKSQLEELHAEGTVVVTSGVSDTEEFGIETFTLGKTTNELVGKILAAQAVIEKGEEANIAFYSVPELAFVRTTKASFGAEIEKLCPSCAVHYVDVPVAAIGNIAPNQVISDLQQNPDTNIAVFTPQEVSEGLSAALKTAGIEVSTFGFAPTPTNLQYIKNGEETAGLGFDIPVNAWTMVDMAAREIVGQELSPIEKAQKAGLPPAPDMQFLTQSDINFDPTNGWTGYPEFAERFTKLWEGK